MDRIVFLNLTTGKELVTIAMRKDIATLVRDPPIRQNVTIQNSIPPQSRTMIH
jgi:hypothetical protein